MTIYTNDDGLQQAYGTDAARVNLVGAEHVNGAFNKVKVLIDTDVLTNLTAGTTGQVVPLFDNVAFPEGALITKSTLYVLEAFTSGGSATLDIGLAKKDGTELDFDGIDAAIALTSLDAVGEQVTNDGALVKGVALTAAGVPYVKAGTAAFTAGKALVEIEYKTGTSV